MPPACDNRMVIALARRYGMTLDELVEGRTYPVAEDAPAGAGGAGLRDWEGRHRTLVLIARFFLNWLHKKWCELLGALKGRRGGR